MTSALSVKDLSVRYKEGNIALKNINLEIQSGDYLGIIGPNGGGKSTLFKAILHFIPCQGGPILFFGKPLKETRDLIGYVPQFVNIDKSYPITSKEVVVSALLGQGLHFFHKASRSDKKKADEILEKVGLSHLANRQIESLSGGEFQRLLIARALVKGPQLLLLDEPTASVDPASREQIYSLLGSLNEQGITIILISHDLMAIASQVKHLACISENLIYHGNPEIDETIVKHMYGCPVDLIAHGVPHRVLPMHEGHN